VPKRTQNPLLPTDSAEDPLKYVVGPSPSASLRAAALAAVVILSYTTWRWVESPFRIRFAATEPADRGGWRTACWGLVASGGVLSLALAIVQSGGLPARFTAAELCFGEVQVGTTSWHDGIPRSDGTFHLPSVGTANQSGTCFLLWGDSHAHCVAATLDELAQELGIRGAVAVAGATPPIPGAWFPPSRWGRIGPDANRQWQEDVLAWIRNQRPRHVILAATWSTYVPRYGARGIASIHADDQPRLTPPEIMGRGLDVVLRECESINATLWVLLDFPMHFESPQQRAIRAHLLRRAVDLIGINRASHERHNSLVLDVVAQLPSDRLRVIDMGEPFFAADGVSRMGTDTECWYSDSSHITKTGAEYVLGKLLRQMLIEIRVDCLPP